MRVKERSWPNTQIRSFNCDQVISPHGQIRQFDTRKHTAETERLYGRLEAIHLVSEVSLDKYEVRITIQDGFQYGDEDWSRVRESVLKILADHFGLLQDDIQHATV
jgi:hypothetical protein